MWYMRLQNLGHYINISQLLNILKKKKKNLLTRPFISIFGPTIG